MPRVDPGWEKYFEFRNTDIGVNVRATSGLASLSPSTMIKSSLLRTTRTASLVIEVTRGSERGQILGKDISVGVHAL